MICKPLAVAVQSTIGAMKIKQNWAILSNSRRVPEFADGCLPTQSCLDQGL
jgi:hypothetical protein